MVRALPRFEKREALGLVVIFTVATALVAGAFETVALAKLAAILGFALLVPLILLLEDRLPFVAPSDGTEPSRSAVASAGSDGGPSVGLDGGHEGDVETGPDGPDPLARLRDRYARGEIDEAEFDRRLDRLIETEDLDLDDRGATSRRVADLE